jgi:hypothetical protein
MNTARKALTAAVNRAIANGAPVYVNQPGYPYYEADAATQRRFRMEAFVTGYRHGCMRNERMSLREATERFPRWANAQIECYLNGQDDGIVGDHTRFVPIYDELHAK